MDGHITCCHPTPPCCDELRIQIIYTSTECGVLDFILFTKCGLLHRVCTSSDVASWLFRGESEGGGRALSAVRIPVLACEGLAIATLYCFSVSGYMYISYGASQIAIRPFNQTCLDVPPTVSPISN